MQSTGIDNGLYVHHACVDEYGVSKPSYNKREYKREVADQLH
jgi:hypothetical protein